MKKHNYTLEDIKKAINSSISISQVLKTLGLSAAGGNYKTIHNYIQKYNINTSHFKGRGWNKDQKIGPKRPINDYLSNKQTITSYKLKLRLLNDNIFDYKCYQCNNTHWLGKQIPLELHHINGNSKDNTINNITLLCPNCHAFTSNYRSKNKNGLCGT